MNLIIEHDIVPGEWTPTPGPPVADSGPELRSGSLSSTEDDGTRTIYMFGWHDGDGPKLWKSRSGADIEAFDEKGWPRRIITSEALDVVEELTVDKPTVLRLRQKGREFSVRFRLVP
jgi:hypothetical protein